MVAPRRWYGIKREDPSSSFSVAVYQENLFCAVPFSGWPSRNRRSSYGGSGTSHYVDSPPADKLILILAYLCYFGNHRNEFLSHDADGRVARV
ncbi:hypothetical protein K1719_027272 [Acacia pycnantha]|nr:hypothetical protein K1719_027272 [Acacia pycnantha]